MITELYDIADRINIALINALSPEDIVYRMQQLSAELRREADEIESQLEKELYDDRLHVSAR
jgi:hypothetical protein